jgi:two-component system nitrogen regulation sensor histidine kinase NtrY
VITRSTADLRRSNRELDERRRYIETLVAHLSTAVVSLDPQGKVATANPAVREILGFELGAGDDARVTFREQGLGPLADLLDQALRAGEELLRDLQLAERTPIRHLAAQVSPLRGRSGEPPGSLLMVEDLTDLLQAQKALAWQEVARRIAHEIKNPLTPIQLAAQRLRKKYFAGAPDLGDVLLDSTESIEQEVRGLERLVDEFSRFARMPEIEPRPVELCQVVESVLALYQGVGEIDWQLDLDRRIGIVRVDAEQIRRVLVNLIDNAISAVEGRGSIRVSARPAGDRGVRIEVADSGPGIAREDRDKMFAPYYSTKPRGSGLGLAIVHKVITEHRGTIRIEDNQPHGARFVIDLPA